MSVAEIRDMFTGNLVVIPNLWGRLSEMFETSDNGIDFFTTQDIDKKNRHGVVIKSKTDNGSTRYLIAKISESGYLSGRSQIVVEEDCNNFIRAFIVSLSKDLETYELSPWDPFELEEASFLQLGLDEQEGSIECNPIAVKKITLEDADRILSKWFGF